jgi:diguanylate cyclase (GGDEF)-like protein
LRAFGEIEAIEVSGSRRRLKLHRTAIWASTLLSAALSAIAAGGQQSSGSPVCPHSPITTTRQIHSLTIQQASLACQVRLRAVVVYYDPYRDDGSAVFVTDKTGSVIFVLVPPSGRLPLHPGSYVEVTGVTDPGGYSPTVVAGKVRVAGADRPLPNAHRVTLSSLLMDKEDGGWVELEGVVHAVDSDQMRAVLTLGTDEGPITASTVNEDGANYATLIGSKVLIRGRPSPLVDRNKRQMVGVRLLFPNFEAITVEKSAPRDPFALPLHSLSSLMQFSPLGPFEPRIHIQGQVTLDWPGRILCIQDGKNALCVQTADRTVLHEGQMVNAVGFSARDNYQTTLTDTMLRPGGDGIRPPPIRISTEEAFSGKHNWQLVQIEGRLIGKSIVANDSTLLLSSGNYVFPAVLPSIPSGVRADQTSAWVDGSRLLVTGVFSGKVDTQQIARGLGESRIESFQILLRSPGDVIVLESPPWWNARRLLMLLGLVMIVALVFLSWTAALRVRVEQQTRHIRRSEERFRHLAQHDALTGLAVRNVLIDRLEAAIKGAAPEQASFALLMIDVDRFKPVNDTLGHAAGDELLRVAAKRIQDSVRKTDTVARIGGDEFMVLLLDVCKLVEAEKVAMQVVENVSASILIEGLKVPLSVSIGLTIYPEGGTDAASLMHNADVAMYCAKSRGGNACRVFSPGESPASTNRETSAGIAGPNHVLDMHAAI